MIDSIKADQAIAPHIRNDCMEYGVGAVYEDGICPLHEVTVDVDSYYSALHLSATPPTADRLITTRCRRIEEGFAIYIVEMKNLPGPFTLDVDNLYRKFETVIHDFMKARHRNIFLNYDLKVKRLILYFVSDAYRLAGQGLSDAEIQAALRGTMIELLLSMRPFEFRGKYYMINYKLPNPLIARI